MKTTLHLQGPDGSTLGFTSWDREGKMPNVVLWGRRTFMKEDESTSSLYIYRELWNIVLPENLTIRSSQ